MWRLSVKLLPGHKIKLWVIRQVLFAGFLKSFQIPKRELTLVDKSGYSVRLTLWGKQAEQYDTEGFPVIAFKGVKVGDFGGDFIDYLLLVYAKWALCEAVHFRCLAQAS
jgi:Replication protein A OB domain